VACWAETGEHADRIRSVNAESPRHVWCIDNGGLREIRQLGSNIDAGAVQQRCADITADDLATIVYTSGTTGPPKGCMLTHGNFRAEIHGALEALPEIFERENSSTLLFLPLAHVFARIIEVGAIRAGARPGHTSDIANLTALLQEFQPTFVLAVPRVFEKVYNAASQKAYADNRGKIFDRATQVAITYSQALDKRRGPGLLLKARHRLFDKLVFSKLRASLGG